MSSDDSSFTAAPAKIDVHVWRQERTAFKSFNLVPTLKSRYASLPLGKFSTREPINLVRIDVSLNRFKHKSILDEHVLPFSCHIR